MSDKPGSGDSPPSGESGPVENGGPTTEESARSVVDATPANGNEPTADSAETADRSTQPGGEGAQPVPGERPPVEDGRLDSIGTAQVRDPADAGEAQQPIEGDAGLFQDPPRTDASAHYYHLGLDSATRRFRPAEAQTGTRIENETGVRLERYPDGQGPDWLGSDGKTYDAVGNFPGEHFDQQWSNLQVRIIDHLDKADKVPVDVSQFSPEQIAQVEKFIKPLGPRVFIVGGG